MKYSAYHYAALVSASVAALTAGSARAQSVDATQSSTALTELVVTAQRRTENVQDVPIATAVFQPETLERYAATDPGSLAKLVPSVQVNRAAGATVVFVRGVGSDQGQIGNEPSVAQYLDDIYIASSYAFFDFNSIESVEVLKGPQGTLFGRNAVGGVIHVKTRDPGNEPRVDATATYASYDTISGQLYGSTPINDSLGVNVAAYGTKQNKGWGRNTLTGEDVRFNEAYAIRAKLKWAPTDLTTVILSAGYQYRKSDQGLGIAVVPGTYGVAGYRPEQTGTGFYDIRSDARDQFYGNKLLLLSAHLRHDLGPAQLVSITSYQKTHGPFKNDVDASPTPLFTGAADAGVEFSTQELQLVSNEEGTTQWIVGAFAMHGGQGSHLHLSGSLFPPPSGNDGKQHLDSLALFGQISTEILPRLRLTTGFRYSYDWRDMVGFVTTAGVRAGPFIRKSNVGSPTGKISLDYHVNDDVMVYASYNRGFKSGVFNLADPSALRAVLPEELDSYTLGAKSEFFDRRLRINTEVYYYDYANLQVSTTLGGVTALTNAGGARVKGGEVSLEARPVEPLTINASLAYTDGVYTSFPGGPIFFGLGQNTQIPIPAGCAGIVTTYPTGSTPLAQRACELRGNRMVQTPKLQTSLAATYTVAMAGSSIDFSVLWAHTGKFFFQADNNLPGSQKATDIVNASIQWKSDDRRYSVRVWGKNLLEEDYFLFSTVSGLSGYRYGPSEPRTFGVTLGYSL